MNDGDNASYKTLPHTRYHAIEYPGYVRPESTLIAIENLGGYESLTNVIGRSGSKSNIVPELTLDASSSFSHPVPGGTAITHNLVLKVVKRKRRSATGEIVGQYTAEVAGVIPRTIRFRSMADFQYQPDAADSICRLRVAMQSLDVDTIHKYTISNQIGKYTVAMDHPTTLEVDANIDPRLTALAYPPSSKAQRVPMKSSEEPKSNLRLFPPPLFSRQSIPQLYGFRANPASIVQSSVDEETGEERKRLINRMRWRGYGPASIMFAEPAVPSKPPPNVEEGRKQANANLFMRLQALFVDRPVWTRMSLLNQFNSTEAREIINSKILLPLTCYVFQDGPWRDTLIRFDYDPRKYPEARLYQRLYFRNANHPIARPSVTTRRQERLITIPQTQSLGLDLETEADRKNSHIFDGRTITKETAAFQLCDITDPMLKKMAEESDNLRETCDERDGWYASQALEQIKTVLRHKFFSMLEGHVATDEECQSMLESEGSIKSSSLLRSQRRAGKHNMAKGAMRPEDAAALRLRAALDKNAKLFLGRLS